MGNRSRILALALALLALVANGASLAVTLAVGCSDGSERGLAYGAPRPGLPDPPKTVAAAPPVVDPPAPPAPATWREAMEAADLVDAGDRIPPVAWELALRADALARWSDLAPPRDETTVLQAMKDVETARRKRLCVSGRVAGWKNARRDLERREPRGSVHRTDQLLRLRGYHRPQDFGEAARRLRGVYRARGGVCS